MCSEFEAIPPREIAQKVETIGVAKARTNTFTLLVLGVLAGAFISLGAMLYLVLVTQSTLGFGVTRFIGGIGFSLGLILTVVAGAELFTGNNLLAMAWASRLIETWELYRNWALVYVGNVVGCLGTAYLFLMADIGRLGEGAVGRTAVQLAQAKAALPFLVALSRGILCNALVCLAVWLAMGGRTVADKVLAIILPVAAFVALGLEHSIANWFFFPLANGLGPQHALNFEGVVHNLLVVTLGNLIGGTLLVAGIYWLAYLRENQKWTESQE